MKASGSQYVQFQSYNIQLYFGVRLSSLSAVKHGIAIKKTAFVARSKIHFYDCNQGVHVALRLVSFPQRPADGLLPFTDVTPCLSSMLPLHVSLTTRFDKYFQKHGTSAVTLASCSCELR